MCYCNPDLLKPLGDKAMNNEDKEITLKQKDLIRTWQLLENLRVSLDRIGAINSQGRDKMRLAFDEYFTSTDKFKKGIYGEIAGCSEVLTRLLIKELGQETAIKFSREIDPLTFHLKKY